MRNQALKKFILIVVALIVMAGCASSPPRLHESGLNSRFVHGEDVPFDEYIRQSVQMLEKARVDLNEINRDAILDANRPFELKPAEARFPRNREGRYERGILLIHGLSDSPYLLKPIARHLQKRGFLVRSILLPGHGTVPGDLLNIRYGEWIRATEYGIHQLKRQAEQLYLGGFSTGGALSIHEAMNNKEIKGLILFAPAVGIKSRWAFMADFIKIFQRWLGGEEDDRDYAKYETFAVNGGAQIYHLTRRIDAAFASGQRLSMPVFTVLSEDDISIDTNKMLAVFNAYVTSPKSLLVLYGSEGRKERKAIDGRILFQNSFLPDEHILDYAHISLVMPPDDPHYGKNGGYRYCLHYRNDPEKRMACLHDPQIRQGELTEENMKKYTLRRLTYNPGFDAMIGFLDRFLDGLNEKIVK